MDIEQRADVVKYVVCGHYNITVEQMNSSGRKAVIAEPRQIAMYVCKVLFDMNLSQVGNAFSRDHTTVIHACSKVSSKIRSDSQFEGKVKAIESECRESKPLPYLIGVPPRKRRPPKKKTPVTDLKGGLDEIGVDRWRSMIHRCDSNRANYSTSEVCQDWLDRSNFCDWLKENLVNTGDELDKDILNRHNRIKVYGPDTCLMVPSEVNLAFRIKFNQSDYISHCTQRSNRIEVLMKLMLKYGKDYPKVSREIFNVICEMTDDHSENRFTRYY